MNITLHLERPKTLEPGAFYMRRTRLHRGSSAAFVPVQLVRYASCPAVVVVRDARGYTERCSRDEIYSPAGDPAQPFQASSFALARRTIMVCLIRELAGGEVYGRGPIRHFERGAWMKKSYSKTGRSCRVTFELPARIEAQTVSVCGEFNDWDPSIHPMKKRKGGRFSLTISLKPGHRYRFRYLLDNQKWENDWSADAYIPNDYGEEDSIVDV